MPEEGVEPSRGCPRGILSPLRLPFRHPGPLLLLRRQPLRLTLLRQQPLGEIEPLFHFR